MNERDSVTSVDLPFEQSQVQSEVEQMKRQLDHSERNKYALFSEVHKIICYSLLIPLYLNKCYINLITCKTVT